MAGCTPENTPTPAVSAGYSIPLIDLAADTSRQYLVDREPERYLGHPTTTTLSNGRLLTAYPEGHGKGAIRLKESLDGGRTWSAPLPVPENWATSQETPTLYRIPDFDEGKRLLVFSGLYPIRMAYSRDEGASWTELAPIGDFGGIVAMSSLERLSDGTYMALFHDDGRFIQEEGEAGPFYVYQTRSKDGGLTWSAPEVIAQHPEAHLCEPGLIRSPDGRQLAVLLRENSRQYNSFIIFSDDEGLSWTEPVELPGALTGDRHVGKYGLDGRLFITFRDRTHESPTWGDWVGWVGTYEDLVQGQEGQYRVRIMDNHKDADCCYPGLELLDSGAFLTTTYGHWTPDSPPYIMAVSLSLSELDNLAASTP